MIALRFAVCDLDEVRMAVKNHLARSSRLGVNRELVPAFCRLSNAGSRPRQISTLDSSTISIAIGNLRSFKQQVSCLFARLFTLFTQRQPEKLLFIVRIRRNDIATQN
jgi:hypothetical protein